jgi:hypothetical protein
MTRLPTPDRRSPGRRVWLFDGGSSMSVDRFGWWLHGYLMIDGEPVALAQDRVTHNYARIVLGRIVELRGK